MIEIKFINHFGTPTISKVALRLGVLNSENAKDFFRELNNYINIVDIYAVNELGTPYLEIDPVYRHCVRTRALRVQKELKAFIDDETNFITLSPLILNDILFLLELETEDLELEGNFTVYDFQSAFQELKKDPEMIGVGELYTTICIYFW